MCPEGPKVPFGAVWSAAAVPESLSESQGILFMTPLHGFHLRIPPQGFLLQDSSSRIPPPAILFKDSSCRIPLPGFLSLDDLSIHISEVGG